MRKGLENLPTTNEGCGKPRSNKGQERLKPPAMFLFFPFGLVRKELENHATASCSIGRQRKQTQQTHIPAAAEEQFKSDDSRSIARILPVDIFHTTAFQELLRIVRIESVVRKMGILLKVSMN